MNAIARMPSAAAEGVDGVFNWKDQCRPFESPRWAETVKLLTGEVNAAVDGLFTCGATEVVVADLHNSSRTLSTLDLDPRAKLLQGNSIPRTLGLDSSYSALVFVGQHPLAGAPGGVLTHSGSFVIESISFKGKKVGEIGTRAMPAGDAASCRELRDLVPEAECAEVKYGLSDDIEGDSSDISLSHAASCALIREKARKAMERLGEFKPYRVAGPYELKVVFKKRHHAPAQMGSALIGVLGYATAVIGRRDRRTCSGCRRAYRPGYYAVRARETKLR